MKVKIYIFLAAVLSMPIRISFTAFADELYKGFEISPAYTSVTISPIKKAMSTFNIINHNESNVKVSLSVFEYKDEKILEDSELSKIISILSPKEFELNTGQKKEVKFEVIRPEYLPDGTYEFLVIANLSTANENKSSISQLLAHRVKVSSSLDGKLNPTIKVSSFTIENQLQVQDHNKAIIEIENLSDFEAKPIGYFQLIDKTNTIIHKQIWNSPIIPLKPKEKVTIKFDINLKDHLNSFGPIESEFLLVETLSNSSSISKRTFFFVPAAYIITFAFVSVAILGTYRFYVRYIKKSNIKKIKIGNVKSKIN
ncbi:hypothetical protein D6810_00140 [Candidatus Dojkabacteria bacterium]|uniref:DUF916 domain-containing protein n=1 Tax=Candidatus Dojkabacteria bacterium TaxID=2099670 RepID=A0A3M0Z6J0_9BACT|nr:MAG: hypothetical protein D6810_00140 [Candidatus Dojkabacteria bacterium]